MGQRENWQIFRDLDLSSRKHRAAVCLDEEYIRSSALDMFTLRYLLNRQDAVLGLWTRSGSSDIHRFTSAWAEARSLGGVPKEVSIEKMSGDGVEFSDTLPGERRALSSVEWRRVTTTRRHQKPSEKKCVYKKSDDWFQMIEELRPES